MRLVHLKHLGTWRVFKALGDLEGSLSICVHLGQVKHFDAWALMHLRHLETWTIFGA